MRKPSRREALGWGSGMIQRPPETACPQSTERLLGRVAWPGLTQSHRDALTSRATSQPQVEPERKAAVTSKEGFTRGIP